MRSNIPAVLSAALLFAIAGMVLPAAYHRWYVTRSYRPVTIPVALAPGRLTTGDFNVNLSGLYYVSIEVDYGFGEENACKIQGPESVLHTYVQVWRDGKLIDDGEGAKGFYIAIIDADRTGTYRVDVQVVTDATCLQGGHPRLRVWTFPNSIYADLDEFTPAARFFLLFCAFAALGAYAASRVREFREQRDAGTVFERHGPKYPRRGSKFRTVPRISTLPGFGLYAGVFFGLVAMILMVFELGFRRIPTGLAVNAQRTVPTIAGGAIVVRVEFEGYGKTPRLSVNGKEVTREQLPGALVAELKLRGDWVVYVHGDGDLQWRTVVDVVDVAKGLHAQVVLLTASVGQPSGAKPRNRTAGAAVPHKH